MNQILQSFWSISVDEMLHLGSSAFITDIVIGMSDGLTVPFALPAGLKYLS